jgi:hypothetical protein
VNNPTEEQEQIVLVQYLELKGHTFTAIPNSTFTRSWSQKLKNKRMGVRAGLPDLFIVLKNNIPLFIELKRKKTGKVSPEQKKWLETLADANIRAFVCYGADEAIAVISELEKQ